MEEIVERVTDEKNKALELLKTFGTKTEWLPIQCKDKVKKHVKLYETVSRDGAYVLKARAHLKGCDPKKILKLNTDNCYNTRKQWETGELMGIEQVQQFRLKGINIVRYWINIPVIYDREFLGLQWWRYNKKRKSYLLIFRSIDYDECFQCDENKYVRGTCTTIMNISKECVVTIYTHVHPNGYVPDWIIPLWKEKLRDRMLLYEKVANESYDEIYAGWICDKCQVQWGVNEEKCRKCNAKKI